MNTKNNRERSKTGKSPNSRSSSPRSRTRSEDTRTSARAEARAEGGRTKCDAPRSEGRPEGGRGRTRSDDPRNAARPDGDRNRSRSDASGNTSKPWSKNEEPRSTGFDAELHPDLLIGRNPVSEAIKSGRTIEKIFAGKGTTGSIIKILGEAKDKGTPIIYTDKQGLDRIAGCEQHQGIIAQVSPYVYKTIEDVFTLAKEREEDPFIVVLDSLEDPHNLGAIIRSAEGAGAHGIIIPKRNGVGVTQFVAKASAGAIEYMPVVKVTNIVETLQGLKKEGLWIAACDMDGTEYSHQNLKGPLALVIGAEGAGIGRLIKEKCDFTVSIPMKGRVPSLNASNAAAILLYEIRRQRDNIK